MTKKEWLLKHGYKYWVDNKYIKRIPMMSDIEAVINLDGIVTEYDFFNTPKYYLLSWHDCKYTGDIIDKKIIKTIKHFYNQVKKDYETMIEECE